MKRVSAVTEAAFVERRRRDWNELESLVWRTTREGWKKIDPEHIARVSPLYRDLCADLSWAQAARYAAPLVDYLGGLTAAAHTMLYGPFARRRRARARLGDLLGAFPRAVRAHWRAMLLAALLFFVPLGAGLTIRRAAARRRERGLMRRYL